MNAFDASPLHFVQLAPPVNSWDAAPFSIETLAAPVVAHAIESAADRVTDRRQAPPARPTMQRRGRAAPKTCGESVLAWRQRYYSFRYARTCVQSGKPADAAAYLTGPHGDYVRRRFADLAKSDERYALPLAIIQTPPNVPACEPLPPTNQAASLERIEAPTAAPLACDVTPATNQRAAPDPRCGAFVAMRLDLRRAVRQILAALPTFERCKQLNVPIEERGAVRIYSQDNVLKIGVGPNVPGVSPARVDRVEVDAPIDVLLSHSALLEKIITLEPADCLAFKFEGGELHIRSADAHYKLFAARTPAATLASPDAAPPAVTIDTTVAELQRVLRTALSCADKNDGRYALNAVALDVTADACEIIATDGRRLIACRLAATFDLADPSTPIVAPISLVDAKALRKTLQAAGRKAKLRLTIGEPEGEAGRLILIEGESIAWQCRASTSTYPEWRSFFSQSETATTYSLDCETFGLAARIGATNSPIDKPCVRLSFEQRDACRHRPQSASAIHFRGWHAIRANAGQHGLTPLTRRPRRQGAAVASHRAPAHRRVRVPA